MDEYLSGYYEIYIFFVINGLCFSFDNGDKFGSTKTMMYHEKAAGL